MSAKDTYDFERVSIQAVSKVPQNVLLVPGFLGELLEQLGFLYEFVSRLGFEAPERYLLHGKVSLLPFIDRLHTHSVRFGIRHGCGDGHRAMHLPHCREATFACAADLDESAPAERCFFGHGFLGMRIGRHEACLVLSLCLFPHEL